MDVVLVGTMHYNPASIELAASSVRRLSNADDLDAIVLEKCPSPWAKTLKMQPQVGLCHSTPACELLTFHTRTIWLSSTEPCLDCKIT